MRRASAMPHSVGSLSPDKRHSRLTIVRRGCNRCRIAGIHGEAMYTAPDYPHGVCHIRKAAELPTAVQCAARAVLQDKNCQCAGSRGKAPCVLLGDLKGAILSRERMAPFAAPLRVRREKHAVLQRCITRSGTLPQPPHPRSDTAARPWRKTSHSPRRIRRSSADATLSRLRFRHSPASRSS